MTLARGRRVVAASLVALGLTAAALAQRIMVTPGGGFLRVPPKWATAEDFDGSFIDIPADHPIMHPLYDVKEVPQVSSINFWRRSGGGRRNAVTTARVPTSAASTTRAAV